MSVSAQRALVNESFQRLSPVGQYVFLLLMVERLVTICKATFPSGLPTRMVAYEEVDESMAGLWSRVDVIDQKKESIASTAEAWRPFTPAGLVQHEPGAALGFHVADLISRLAFADLHHQIDGILDVAWEAVQSLLFRMPENPDYSVRFIDTELDPDLNAALLLEYEIQRAALATLNSAADDAFADLRHASQMAALVIAEREGDHLKIS